MDGKSSQVAGTRALVSVQPASLRLSESLRSCQVPAACVGLLTVVWVSCRSNHSGRKGGGDEDKGAGWGDVKTHVIPTAAWHPGAPLRDCLRLQEENGGGDGWGDESPTIEPAPAPAPRRKPKTPLKVESGSEGEEGDGWGNF